MKPSAERSRECLLRTDHVHCAQDSSPRTGCGQMLLKKSRFAIQDRSQAPFSRLRDRPQKGPLPSWGTRNQFVNTHAITRGSNLMKRAKMIPGVFLMSSFEFHLLCTESASISWLTASRIRGWRSGDSSSPRRKRGDGRPCCGGGVSATLDESGNALELEEAAVDVPPSDRRSNPKMQSSPDNHRKVSTPKNAAGMICTRQPNGIGLLVRDGSTI